jgi:hypothetical protein
MRVGKQGFAGSFHRQLAGHAEMDQQMIIFIEVENNPFSSAAYGDNAMAGKLPLPRLSPPPPQTFPAYLNSDETPVNDPRRQFTNDGLNFR